MRKCLRYSFCIKYKTKCLDKLRIHVKLLKLLTVMRGVCVLHLTVTRGVIVLHLTVTRGVILLHITVTCVEYYYST